MLEQAIFNEITSDATLAGKLQDGANYRVYPNFAPKGDLPDKLIVYNEVTQSLVYPALRTSLFQFTCVAKTYAEAIDLANDIDRIFNDLSEHMLGGVKGVKYVRFVGRTNLYDNNAEVHQSVVEILFKY